MERQKSVIKFFITIALAIFCIGWYIPGKDPESVKLHDDRELSYKEAISIDTTYSVEKGKMFKEWTYYIQEERTNIPLVYKKDTLKYIQSYYLVGN